VRDYRDLKVWVRAHQLTLAVYSATSEFPRGEEYGLKSQIRRACASIPANIAEGCGRDSRAELARFMTISMGSASELDYHLLLAHDLTMLTDLQYETLSQELVQVRKMLTAFVQKLTANG